MTSANSEIEYLQREALNTQVIIYDEVLMEQMNGKKDADLQSQDLETTLQWKGIYIHKEICLESAKENINTSFTGEGNATIDDLANDIKKNYFNENVPKDERYKYIIVHYSGFEKLYKRIKDTASFGEYSNEKDKFNLAFNNFVKQFNCEENGINIVLCSGKVPNVLPNNALFIDRQSLKYLIFDISSKIQLTNQLNSLRIKNK